MTRVLPAIKENQTKSQEKKCGKHCLFSEPKETLEDFAGRDRHEKCG